MGLVNSVSGGRRLSNVSDSGDTGIGTYCSDSVEGRMVVSVSSAVSSRLNC